jgi:outer membrane protein TolC
MTRGWLSTTVVLALVVAAVAQPPAAPPPNPAPPQAAPLYAQAAPTTYPIDLPTVLRLADADNPTVAVARARVREAVANLDRARVAWVPNLVFGPTFFYHAGVDQNRRGEIFSVARGNYTLTAGPQARFDLGDALYLPLVARRLVRAADARARATGNDAQLAAAIAYLDLLELHALLAVNADTLDRAEQVLQSAQAGARAGLNKTAADVNRAATEVNLRREERYVLRGRVAAASARLAQILMLDPTVELLPFEVAVVPVVLVPGDLSLDQLVRTGLGARPEVAAAGAEVQAAETMVRQAKAAPFLPRVQGEFLGGGLSGGVNDDFGPLRGQFNTSVAAVWQLDNMGAGNAAIIRARQAGVVAAAARMREVQSRVAAEVVEAAQTAAYRYASLPAAQDAVREALEMYRKFREASFGIVGPRPQFDALEPLTAVQALNTARVSYLNQVVEFNRAQFRLYTAMGRPAACAVDTAAAQPVQVPAVPPPVSQPLPLPRPEVPPAKP